jgi:chromosome segregation protein
MNAFNFVNDNFFKLFSQIFHGNGRLILENAENPFEGGLTIEVALDNKEVKYLELMSGGEKSLVALIFLFALQAYNPSSVYILDEADSALDQENSRKLALLVSELSKKSQFLLISHNQAVYKSAQCLVGITMTKEGSKVVEVKLHEKEETGGITVA